MRSNRHRRIRLIMLALVTSAAASTAHATVIAVETFDYAGGTSLIGQSGGYGWAGPWYITSAGGKNYTPQSIGTACNVATPGSAYGSLDVCGGRGVGVNSGSEHRAYRDLDLIAAHRPELAGLIDTSGATPRLGADNTTIWIGFIGALNTGAASISTYGAWHLYDGIDPTNTTDGNKLLHEKILVGDRNQAVVWTVENTRQNNPLGLSNNNFNNLHYDASSGPAANTVSTTPALLVVRIDFRPISATQTVGEERVRVWINPAAIPGADPSATPASIDTDTPAYGGMFKDFRFDIFQFGSVGEQMTIDELRITTTFDELVLPLHPTISQPPHNGWLCGAQPAGLSVTAQGVVPLSYQWRLTGAAIPGANQATYTIPTPTLAVAGTYDCVVSSPVASCAQTISAPATLTWCPADFDCSGALTVQDVFDFLAAWFASNPRSDVNGSGAATVQDIFDFLASWFAGCGA